jgi:hypothetical protein
VAKPATHKQRETKLRYKKVAVSPSRPLDSPLILTSILKTVQRPIQDFPRFYGKLAFLVSFRLEHKAIKQLDKKLLFAAHTHWNIRH